MRGPLIPSFVKMLIHFFIARAKVSRRATKPKATKRAGKTKAIKKRAAPKRVTKQAAASPVQ